MSTTPSNDRSMVAVGASGGTANEDWQQQYWKDDFVPLQVAGKSILQALRQDEAAPDADLYRRITHSNASASNSATASYPENNPSHRYFVEDNTPPANPTTPTANGSGMPLMGQSPAGGVSPTNGNSKEASTSLNLNHERSIPLPPYIAQQMKTVKYSTYMGLFPEAELAWVTIDEKLFLWSFKGASSKFGNFDRNGMRNGTGAMEDFIPFTHPRNMRIISVGLVPPKPGMCLQQSNLAIGFYSFSSAVFLCANASFLHACLNLHSSGVFRDEVEWCLVVTTEEDAILCALARVNDTKPTNGAHQTPIIHPSALPSSPLKLVQTSYFIPSDWVKFISVCGSKDGRIFFGGHDGKLYEMDYDGLKPSKRVQQLLQQKRQLEDFYDSSKPCPAVLEENAGSASLIKRALSTVAEQFEPSSSSRPRKCRKLNHSGSSVVSSFVPDFLLNATSSVFGAGTTTGGGPIVQMVVDEERKVLYTLSSRGWISAFDIGLKPALDGKPVVRLAGVMDSAKTAQRYLEAVARNHMYPPNSSSGGSKMGIITFPGGGIAAQAGVGGMEGARTILRLASNKQRRGDDDATDILTPVALHVVPRRESARLTLVAVTAGGLRYYISSLSPYVLSNGPSQDFGTNRRTDPLAPYSKLTFCHIRAPPPLPSKNGIHGFATNSTRSSRDGILPQMASAMNQLSRVDASWYRLGVFVVALRRTSSLSTSRTTSNSTPIGNVIVTACADSVARVREPVDLTSTRMATSSGTDKMVVPGGICEVLSLPMSAASGLPSFSALASQESVNGDNGNNVQLLPGGLVYDMSVDIGAESPVLSLALNSKTPTDGELSVGLVPAFFPKSEGRSQRSFSGGIGKVNSSQQLALVNNTDSSRPNTSVLLTFVTNFMLNRPLRYGIDVQRPLLEQGGDAYCERPVATYRISQRYGVSGFSLSAGDEKTGRRVSTAASAASTRSTKTSVSARLSPWQLRPAVVPLNALALQHLLLPSRQMVALNAGGLHYFGIRTVLMSLSDAILSAGVNVNSDANITKFFESYGYAEGCAMCWLLAIGYGGSTSAESKDRASKAALARAFRPKLVASQGNGVSAQNGTSVVTQSSSSGSTGSGDFDDGLIPSGYKFVPSALCDSLSLVLARLLRPIWHKPAVVVTEGRVVQRSTGSFTSTSRTTAAKVELLLDDLTLEEIRQPLHSLLSLMRRLFSRAIETIPGVRFGIHDSDGVDSMEVDENTNPGSGQEHFLTRALEYHQHSRAGRGGTFQLRHSEAEEIARLAEERSIHSFYRLLSRTVQLLSLLSHLKRAHDMPDLPEVEWGLLHGLSIAQIVQTRDGQERMESLLNSLITTSAGSPSAPDMRNRSAPSAEASQFANVLTEQCYHFFSPGSRFAYLGFRSADEALSHRAGTTLRRARQDEAVKYLKWAARHWNSPPLITGQILRTKDRGGYEELARRAYQYDSPLARGVAMLIELGEVSGVVDICLLTAANFIGKKAGIIVESSDTVLPEYTSKNLLPWEKGLYHKKRVDTQSTASASSAMGTTVDAKDAVDTCYALVFYNVAQLLNSSDKFLGEQMVSVCAAATDKDFLHAFFKHLLESNHADTLLRIDSFDLENWLISKNSNPELLYKFYVTQGKHVKAGETAWKLAKQSGELDIDKRIEWLVRSNDSYSSALQVQHPTAMIGGWVSPGAAASDPFNQGDLQRLKNEVADNLALATIQSRILNTLNSSRFDEPLEDLEKEKKRLQTSLLDFSTLYNDIANPASMFENCLRIFHACRYNSAEHIRTHWKGVFCEEIFPCSTRRKQVFNFSQGFIADIGDSAEMKGLSITLVAENASANDSLPMFEDGMWRQKLESRIISLGKELYGTGADFVFPLDFIAECLEGKFMVDYASISCALPLFNLSLFRAVGLQRAYVSAISPSIAEESQNWPFKILVSVGVPYLAVLDAYERVIETEDHQQMGGVDPQRRLEHLTCVVVLLESWYTVCQSIVPGSRNAAMEQVWTWLVDIYLIWRMI